MADNNPIELDVADVLTVLSEGQIEVEGLLPYSSNYTMLALVEHDELRLPAVYKPQRGERPLWDFPRGTLYQREVAAYLISEALGFGFVPPTIVRDGSYGVGALQLYIDNDDEAHLFTMQREGRYEPAIKCLAAFDYLINNADRKSGHCLKGSDNRLWAIDHGLCFHSEYKLRTVLWDYVGEPFPPAIATALQNLQERLRLPDDALTQALTQLIDAEEWRALCSRLAHMLSLKAYPAPGPGPHMPWPPV